MAIDIRKIADYQLAIPAMRKRRLPYVCEALRPNKDAYHYIDDVGVDNYIQKTSCITTTTALPTKPKNSTKYETFGVKYTGLSSPNAREEFISDSTHAYATVIGTSPSGKLYLNENYLSFHISNYSADPYYDLVLYNRFRRGTWVHQWEADYTDVDLINNQRLTFSGRVVRWDSTNYVLTVEPVYGTPDTVNKTLYINWWYSTNIDGPKANLDSIIVGDKFPVGSNLVCVSNSSLKFLVSSYEHNSGVLGVAPANGSVITINGVTPNTTGAKLYITHGTGEGQFANIVSSTSNTVTLDSPLYPIPEGNSNYSIGRSKVDGNGFLAGIFNIPEDTLRFQDGPRVLTITDSSTYGDANATMLGSSNFSRGRRYQSAELNLNEKLGWSNIKTRKQVKDKAIQALMSVTNRNDSTGYEDINDPIAQTFFTPPSKVKNENYGIFVSSVDLWFSNKPATNSPQLPVTVSIVETENGFPTDRVLGESSCAALDVVVVDTASLDGDSSNSNETKTKFAFERPVYLQPSTEYAIIINSESPEYDVWVSEIGGDNLVDKINKRRISEQPNAGSFFRAQNASKWAPIANQDLMFVVNKSQYQSGPTTLRFVAKGKDAPTFIDSLILSSSDLALPNTSIKYNVTSMIAESGFFDNGIDTVPNIMLNYGKDLRSSSKDSSRRRMIDSGNVESFFVDVTMASNDPDSSPLLNGDLFGVTTFTNLVNPGWITPYDISITNGGNHLNAANIVVTFSAPDISTGTTATANVLTLTSNTVTGLNIINPGSGYTTTPTVVISEPSATSNATAIIAGETQASGGFAYARYMTRKITLADGFDAGDLRVFLNAVKPQGTNIAVYYKVLSASDSSTFESKTWVQMVPKQDYVSPDQESVVELEYVPNVDSNGIASGALSYVLNGVSYPLGGSFRQFAIKIVLLADDPTVPPVVRAMRTIALPKG